MEPNNIFKDYWQRKRGFFESIKNFMFERDSFIKWLYFIPGDWDIKSTSFKDYQTYRHMKDLYQNNYDYRKTKRYRDLIEKVENGEIHEHKGIVMKSKEDVVNLYFKRYIKIFKSMEKEGYNSNIFRTTGCVAIGRNGELIKTARGRHRLSIAQIRYRINSS